MQVRNAKVFTATGGFVSAFATRGDTITWVGDADAAPAPDPGEAVLDLGGATVLPGLLDVHTHPSMLADLVDAVGVLPPAVTSVEDLVAAVAASPRRGAGDDTWIEAWGYDDSRYPAGRGPLRADLDRISSTQPILARRCDAHSAVANSAALRRAGITRDTPDPDGAALGRDADGEPDGRLIEMAAVDLVSRCLPEPSRAERIARIARLGQHFLRRGLVGVGDLLASRTPDALTTFRAAAQQADLPRVGLYPLWQDIAAQPPTLNEDDRRGHVFVAGCKLLMDGAFSNATAWTHDPYPGTCSHGLRTTTPDELTAATAWARANGVQLAVHAMGDAAIDAALDALAGQEPWLDDLPSVRLEHASLFTPERIARVRDARMRFAVVSHAIFLHAEYEAYARHLSPAQFAHLYPLRSFHAQVPCTALASDAPATAHSDADNVFVSVQAAVTRRAWNGADMGQAEALTVAEALALYTSRAATCMNLPRLGAIEPGREATFVVLDRDVFTLPADRIAETRVAQTWVAGRRVHPQD